MFDQHNRKALAIDEPGFSILAARLIRVMNRLVDFYGLPDAIKCDKGVEMAGHAFNQKAEDPRYLTDVYSAWQTQSKHVCRTI